MFIGKATIEKQLFLWPFSIAMSDEKMSAIFLSMACRKPGALNVTSISARGIGS